MGSDHLLSGSKQLETDEAMKVYVLSVSYPEDFNLRVFSDKVEGFWPVSFNPLK